MATYPRHEEIQLFRAAGDVHVDVAAMMREAQEVVEATSLRKSEQIVAVEPWGTDTSILHRGDVNPLDAPTENQVIYWYRVTIDLLPIIGSSEFA